MFWSGRFSVSDQTMELLHRCTFIAEFIAVMIETQTGCRSGARCSYGPTYLLEGTQIHGVSVVGGKLKVSVRDSVVVWDFSDFSVDNDTFAERISEVSAVIEQIVLADVARLGTDDDEHARLLPLIWAAEFTY